MNLMEGTEYRIFEVETDPHLVMSLGLVWPMNLTNNARVRLPHRLKETYRHAVKDHGWKDGIGLRIKFEKAGDRWGMSLRPPGPFEARKERTDACRRHQWAIKVVLASDDLNALGDQMHCSCPTDSACEVCTLAEQYSMDRRRFPTQTRHWSELGLAVRRDIGRIA
jgi:hypothetical protein